MSELRGWVYVITNQAMPGIVKIGHSLKDPTLRAQRFEGTGVPFPFVVEYEVLLADPRSVEGAVHKKLASYREAKEWFRCSVPEAVRAIRGAISSPILLERGVSEAPTRFVDLGNGVLEDKVSLLQWTQSDDGAGRDWLGARGGGWRLPTASELQGIYSSEAPRTNPHGCRVPPQFHLTGTSYATISGYTIDLYTGQRYASAEVPARRQLRVRDVRDRFHAGDIPSERELADAYDLLARPPGRDPKFTLSLLETVICSYSARHAARPDEGHDIRASEWRSRLRKFRASVRAPSEGNSPSVEKLLEAVKRDFGSIRASTDRAWSRVAAARVIDCVLSLNRHYDRFVVPRLDKFELLCPAVSTVRQLRELIDTFASAADFTVQVLNYRDPARADVLSQVTDFVLAQSGSTSSTVEIEDLRMWAEDVQPSDFRKLGIRGFGLAGFQYLRMLFGANTTKPDRHIRRYVARVVGRSVNDVECLVLLEAVGEHGCFLVRDLDAAIWERLSRRGE